MKKFIILAIILWSSTVYAKHINVERYYQDIWCAERNGQVEVVMKDNTR